LLLLLVKLSPQPEHVFDCYVLFSIAHIVVLMKQRTHNNMHYWLFIVDIYARLQDATNCLPFQIAKVYFCVNYFTQTSFSTVASLMLCISFAFYSIFQFQEFSVSLSLAEYYKHLLLL